MTALACYLLLRVPKALLPRSVKGLAISLLAEALARVLTLGHLVQDLGRKQDLGQIRRLALKHNLFVHVHGLWYKCGTVIHPANLEVAAGVQQAARRTAGMHALVDGHSLTQAERHTLPRRDLRQGAVAAAAVLAAALSIHLECESIGRRSTKKAALPAKIRELQALDSLLMQSSTQVFHQLQFNVQLLTKAWLMSARQTRRLLLLLPPKKPLRSIRLDRVQAHGAITWAVTLQHTSVPIQALWVNINETNDDDDRRYNLRA